MFDARVNGLFYKIQVTEGDVTRIVHKVVESEAIKVMLPLDEEGQAINAKYVERASKERKAPLTKEEKRAKIEERIAKLEAQKAELEARLAEIEAAEATTETTEDTTETTEDTTEDEDLA
jgi:exonuclease VII small subunit